MRPFGWNLGVWRALVACFLSALLYIAFVNVCFGLYRKQVAQLATQRNHTELVLWTKRSQD